MVSSVACVNDRARIGPGCFLLLVLCSDHFATSPIASISIMPPYNLLET